MSTEDPQNYMYLAADLHLEKDRFRDPQKQRSELQKFPLKMYVFKYLNKSS